MPRPDDISAPADGLIAAVRSQAAAAAAEQGSQQPAAASPGACGHAEALPKEAVQPATASLDACVQQAADVHAQPAAADFHAGVQQPAGAPAQPAALSLNACVRHLPRKWDQQRLKALLQEQGLEYAVVR